MKPRHMPLVCLLLLGTSERLLLAQAPGGTTDPPNVTSAPPSQATAATATGPEYVLSSAVLVFGLFVVGVVVWVILKNHHTWDDASFRALTLPLVIFSGLFLITAGYDENQVAPMFGLLGTLVGYILGQRAGGPPASAPATEGDNG